MADERAKGDANYKAGGVAGGYSSADAIGADNPTIIILRIDPTTGRLLVDSNAGGDLVADGDAYDAATEGSVVFGTDGTNYFPLLTDNTGALQVAATVTETEDTDDDSIAGGQTLPLKIVENYWYDKTGPDWVRAQASSDGYLFVRQMGAYSDGGNSLTLATQADDLANTIDTMLTSGFMYVFDGTTWDRLRGDSTNGVLVNLGTNNDVMIYGSDDGGTTPRLIKTDAGGAIQVDIEVAEVAVTSVIPGVGATNLGKAEDAAHSTGDVGVMALGVYNESNTQLASDDGDYIPIALDRYGQTLNVNAAVSFAFADTKTNSPYVLKGQSGISSVPTVSSAYNFVFNGTTWDRLRGTTNGLDINDISAGTQTNALSVTESAPLAGFATSAGQLADGHNVTVDNAVGAGVYVRPGTSAVFAVDLATNNDVTIDGSSIVHLEDVQHNTGDAGIMAMGVENEDLADLSTGDKDYTPLAVTKEGVLIIKPEGTITVDGAVTTTEASAANILTAVQLIDDVVYVDDTATHATGTSKGVGIMGVAVPTDTAVSANDIGMFAMSLDRRLLVDAEIASGGIASGAVASGAVVSGAFVDGSIVTLGAKTDAKSTATDATSITVMQVLKQISASVQAPPSQAVTNAGTFAVQPGAAISGPGNPVIDSYQQVAINLNAAADQVLVSSAASKQIWVYAVAYTVSVAGTVSFQDEDNVALTGIMDHAANSGLAMGPSGNFAMPIWKLGTDKDLECDVVTAAIDGFITYAIVSV